MPAEQADLPFQTMLYLLHPLARLHAHPDDTVADSLIHLLPCFKLFQLFLPVEIRLVKDEDSRDMIGFARHKPPVDKPL